MKPFGKRIAMAVVCAATLTSPFFLSGCSMSELWQGTEQSRKEIAQRSEQDQVQLFNQYVKAISRYNRMAVMFDYANTPTLNELKAGQHLTVFNAPNFKQLQKELEEAKQAGIPYDEMKEPLDKLLSKLNEITPVAEELDAYYKSKGYTTDNYAKEQQLGPKYVQLYEQFVPIYADFDNLMHKINTDRLQQRLQQLRDAGKKNAAAAQDLSDFRLEVARTSRKIRARPRLCELLPKRRRSSEKQPRRRIQHPQRRVCRERRGAGQLP